MTTMAATAAAAPHRRDARRDELAESALRTLGELGYARTSLREIANNSPYTHGVVHYYFRDKAELIIYCVRQYKAYCVTRYDEIVESARTADGLATDFADKLAETIVADGSMHRLWYDLRTQAMFDESLSTDVVEIDGALEAMVWRIVTRYAELGDTRTTVSMSHAYSLLDGVFEHGLFGYLAGRESALDELRGQVKWVLPRLVSG